MSVQVQIEVIGFGDSACGPFPCDDERSCDLDDCFPTESLTAGFDALKKRMQELYGEQVDFKLTLIDNEVPDYVQEIVEKYHPPLPIILVNGRVTPIGRISFPQILEEVQTELKETQ